MEGRRRIYAQSVLNFKKSAFVEKALKGSQEGPRAAAAWGCRWGCWVSAAGALLRDLVQGEAVAPPWGRKPGAALGKSGKFQTDQTREPCAFVQPRVVTAEPGCASTESPGWGFWALEEDRPLGRCHPCEQSTQLILLRGSHPPPFCSVCWTRTACGQGRTQLW